MSLFDLSPPVFSLLGKEVLQTVQLFPFTWFPIHAFPLISSLCLPHPGTVDRKRLLWRVLVVSSETYLSALLDSLCVCSPLSCLTSSPINLCFISPHFFPLLPPNLESSLYQFRGENVTMSSCFVFFSSDFPTKCLKLVQLLSSLHRRRSFA